MRVETTTPGQRTAQLQELLERWAAEHPAILAIDAERARHHLEAIVDLQSLIHQLEASDVPGPAYSSSKTGSVAALLGA